MCVRQLSMGHNICIIIFMLMCVFWSELTFLLNITHYVFAYHREKIFSQFHYDLLLENIIIQFP